MEVMVKEQVEEKGVHKKTEDQIPRVQDNTHKSDTQLVHG